MKDKLLKILNKKKETIKNNKIAFIIFVVVWVLTIVITLSYYKSSLGMKSFGNDEEPIVVYEINKNVQIEETVGIDYDINSVSIKFATYARKNKGNLAIKVTDVSGKNTYIDKNVNVNDVLDNSFMTFEIKDKSIKNSKTLKIYLSSDSEFGEAVGVYCTNQTFSNSKLIINEEEVNQDMKVRFLMDNTVLHNFNDFALILTILSLTIIVFMIIINDKLEITFSIMTLLFGIIFMIIITPMSPPDEQTHYEYSFQLSNKIMGKEYRLIDQEYQDYSDFAGHLNVSSGYERISEDISKPLKLTGKYETIENDLNDATYYLCYIPQAIAITMCRVLKANMLTTFYAGRLFNLLLFVVCVYFGVKKTPIHKELFGILSTAPIFIQQASSYSYDSFLNGGMLLIAAFLFDWMYKEEEISNKEILVLLLITLLITPLKRVYCLFIFCLWFIPWKKFGSKKRKIVSLSIVSLPILVFLVSFMVPYFSKFIRNYIETLVYSDKFNSYYSLISTNEFYSMEIATQNIAETRSLFYIGYMAKNIPEIINLYVHTIRTCIKIWFYESIGRVLSGVSLLMPLKLVHIMAILTVVAAFMKEKHVIPIQLKIVFVLICISIGIFVMTGMLLTWTHIGDEIIQGMQGRYFSPLLYFFMTIFSNKFISLPKKFNKYLIFSQTLMMFEVMMYVLSYTFVN